MTADIRINMKNEENHNYKLICRISETSSPLATTSRRDHCLLLNVVELYKRERQKTEKSQRAAGNPEFPRQDAFYPNIYWKNFKRKITAENLNDIEIIL